MILAVRGGVDNVNSKECTRSLRDLLRDKESHLPHLVTWPEVQGVSDCK